MIFQAPSHHARVLLAHGIPSELEFLREVLATDFEVTTAESADAALGLLRNSEFDVVIGDDRLPSANDMDFMQECQQSQPAASRILLIGTLERTKLLTLIREGNMDACLEKPVAPNILISTVLSASRASRLIRERSSLIGELAEANARIYSERQRLIGINSELRTLLAIATHDLREPLRSTRFFLDRCLDSLEQNTAIPHDYLIRVRKAHDRMDGLLHNLREWLHLQTGEIDLRPVEMSTVVSEAVESLARLISEREVKLVAPEEWPIVLGNAPLLRSVVENLISNAIRFSVDGPPRIELTWRHAGQTAVRISVADNGIGIDPDYHDQIFGMFKRLESRKTFEGTGAGLAICQKIIQRHHGRLGVESTRGDGATFWFELPTRREE